MAHKQQAKEEEATGTGCVCRLGFSALSLDGARILGEASWPSALDKQRGEWRDKGQPLSNVGKRWCMEPVLVWGPPSPQAVLADWKFFVGSACGWYVFDQSPRGPAPERRRPWTRSRAQQGKNTAHTTPVVSRRSVGVCAAVANTRNTPTPRLSPSRGGLLGGVREGDTQAQKWSGSGSECARSGRHPAQTRPGSPRRV